MSGRRRASRGSLRRGWGYSLMELAIVLAIVALAIGGALLLYADASESRKHDDLMSEIILVVATVHQLSSGSPTSQSGATSALVMASKAIPHKWMGTSALTDPWGHPLSVYPGIVAGNPPNGLDPDTLFSITLAYISNTECERLATASYGESLVGLDVDGTYILQDAGLDPTTAASACGNLLTTFNGTIVMLFR